MAQYTTGTVSVTNGSNVVTGSGTAFLTNVIVGNSFNISGENVVYTVASVDSDTQIKLSVNYEGTTSSGSSYQISTSFTPNSNFYEVNIGDKDWPIHLTQNTIRKIDAELIFLAKKSIEISSLPFFDSGSSIDLQMSNIWIDDVNGGIWGASKSAVYYAENGVDFVIKKQFDTDCFVVKCLYVSKSGNVFASPLVQQTSPENTDAGLWLSSDIGTTWIKVIDLVDNAGAAFHPLAESSNGDLFAVAYGSSIGTNVRKSTDGGSTWVDITSNITLDLYGERRHGHTIVVDSEDTIYLSLSELLAGGFLPNNAPCVIKSTDGGLTWVSAWNYNSLEFPNFTTVAGIYAGDGFRLFSCEMYGQFRLVRTTDDINVTIVLQFPIANNLWDYFWRIAYDSVNDIIYMPLTSGKLYASYDKGINWKLITSISKPDKYFYQCSNLINGLFFICSYYAKPADLYKPSQTWDSFATKIQIAEGKSLPVTTIISSDSNNSIDSVNDKEVLYNDNGTISGSGISWDKTYKTLNVDLGGASDSNPSLVFNIDASLAVKWSAHYKHYTGTTNANPNWVLETIGGTPLAPAKVASGQGVMTIAGRGYADTDSKIMGRMTVYAESAPTDTSSPGRIALATTPLNSTTTVEHFNVSSSGIVSIYDATIPTDNTGSKLVVTGKIKSTTGGFVFPDNSTQETAAVSNNSSGTLGKIQISNGFGGFDRNDLVYLAGDIMHVPDIWLGTSPTFVKDNLTSTDANKALSANQGKVLSDRIPLITQFYIPVAGVSSYASGQIYDDGTNVGINKTSSFLGKLHSNSTTATAVTAERSGSSTNSAQAALSVLATTSADMIDGFGVGITFNIKDSANVINNIAQIIASRSGADNSGDLLFRTVSTGTASEKMRIDSAGNVRIGVDATNNAILNVTNGLVLNGTATVWKDVFFVMGQPMLTGAGNPSLVTWNTPLRGFAFAVNDAHDFNPQEFPHEGKQGAATGSWHIHWISRTNVAATRGVKWQLEYSIADVNGVFPAPTTISVDVTVAANTADKTHLISTIGTFTTPNIAAQIYCRLTRIASAGTAPATDPVVIGVHFHYEVDTLGSQDLLTK